MVASDLRYCTQFENKGHWEMAESVLMKRLMRTAVFGLIAIAVPSMANAQGSAADCPSTLVHAIPDSPSGALDGSAFARQVATLSGTERDAVVGPMLLAGDIPQFLRRLRPVTLRAQSGSGKNDVVTICVMPDYLAIGSDEDFVRVPMGLRTAAAIATRFGFLLPTTKIVDAIYSEADIRVRPEPLPAGPEMRSTEYFVRHDRLVRQESLIDGLMPGMLLAGQKKDLVITNRLRASPGRVAIYGWHIEDHKPIQSLSTFHGENYADYSHGVRLVSAIAYVGTEQRSLLDILQDPRLATVVSSEGPIQNVRALIASLSSGKGDTEDQLGIVQPMTAANPIPPVLRDATNRK
jgi:hypothetical protein